MSGLLVNIGSVLLCLGVGTVAGAIVVARNGWRLGVRREQAPERTMNLRSKMPQQH